ncbi:hypothetical protein CRP01_23480 [Flavilitoribacter nigricans DSM 23189 = NBRC 102662]|uniref:Uncharacterized protein n=1 Tax=Flavilitoribacter nigricans (strain ATCC 23147 / DSM 23189 / NBRC 102662 / NCIMB 1420 / SS-2) TaxID=1122177 RepID=A0A2D0N6Z7_FLAN2|nr:hypothetical protein CRP01_23480 [Flavilitoribacter nigricans DSM 23189 = NBRC 102662]
MRRLSTRQLSRFGDFLASPYFNKQSNNIAFFDWLRKYAPAFSHRYLEMDHLLEHWPLASGITRKKLHYLVGELNGLLEQFLVVEQLNGDSSGIEFYRLLQQAVVELDIDHLQQKADQKIKQLIDTLIYRDSHYLQRLYQYHLDQYLATDPYQRSFNPRLQTVTDTLDTYYLLSRLRFAWQMHHLEAVASEPYNHRFESELLGWAAAHPAMRVPAVKVYYLGLLLLTEPEKVEHYDAFKTELLEHRDQFPPPERKSLYTGLLNYCIRRGNQFGETKFLREYLKINELLLADGLLLENGTISPWRFVNLKMAALRVDEIDWAWKFIHDYRQYLPEAYRENVFRYALAYLHFYRREYAEAQRLLAQVQFEDLLFNTALRTLLVRVYYEAGEIESLLIPQLEANRLFLLRHKGEFTPTLYGQWKNFNKICSVLAKSDPAAAEDQQKLRELLATDEPILHQEWLEGIIVLKKNE